MSDLEKSYTIVIVGGGEAGLTLADLLEKANLNVSIALIEPSSYRYDQPAWVRVGTEERSEEGTRSPEDFHVPTGIDWIQDRAAAIDAGSRVVMLESGTPVHYDYLAVTTGIGTRWDSIRGLPESLGTQGICSVYGYEQAPEAWDMIRSFEGGKAVFTAPSSPHKGGSTPLNVLHRAETLWRETGVREHTEIFFATASDAAFADEEYAEMIERDAQEEDIHVYVGYELLEVRPDRREAVFGVKKGTSHSEHVLGYDLLHVVPPMRPPLVVENSELSYKDGPLKGYLEVDPESLRHMRFGTVFGVGDVVGTKGVKTGEKARTQAADVARALEDLVKQNA